MSQGSWFNKSGVFRCLVKSGSSGFKYVLSVIGLGLIEFAGTLRPWKGSLFRFLLDIRRLNHHVWRSWVCMVVWMSRFLLDRKDIKNSKPASEEKPKPSDTCDVPLSSSSSLSFTSCLYLHLVCLSLLPPSVLLYLHFCLLFLLFCSLLFHFPPNQNMYSLASWAAWVMCCWLFSLSLCLQGGGTVCGGHHGDFRHAAGGHVSVSWAEASEGGVRLSEGHDPPQLLWV